jgi:hypothetical protein
MIQDHGIHLVVSQSPDHIAVEPRDTLVVEFRNRNAQSAEAHRANQAGIDVINFVVLCAVTTGLDGA